MHDQLIQTNKNYQVLSYYLEIEFIPIISHIYQEICFSFFNSVLIFLG